MAVFEARPDYKVHHIELSVKTDDGFRVECYCGWLSPLCPNGLDVFDAWAGHCIDTADS